MGTSSRARLIASCLVAATCWLSSAFAASDYYLEVEGIKGESRLQPGAIDVTAFSHDVVSPREAGSGLATGRRQHKPAAPIDGDDDGDGVHTVEKASMSDISFSCVSGKASPQLMLACATGQHIPKAVLTCRKAGDKGETYLKVTLEDCLVSSYSSSGNNADDRPTETFSLNFSAVTFHLFLGGGDPSELRVKFIVKK